MENKNSSQQHALSNILPKKTVPTIERILMIAGGAYVLYKALSQKESSTAKNTVGGAMLLRGLSGYCPAYHAAETFSDADPHYVNFTVSTTVNKPILQVYSFWRNLENLPKFMNHLESVETLDNDTSEWTAKGPMGVGKISWKAKVTKEEKNKFLSWKSLEGSTIENAGKVAFRPVGQTTEIDVTILYRAPYGILGEKTAQLFNPYFKNMVKNDIENFKFYLESENP